MCTKLVPIKFKPLTFSFTKICYKITVIKMFGFLSSCYQLCWPETRRLERKEASFSRSGKWAH